MTLFLSDRSPLYFTPQEISLRVWTHRDPMIVSVHVAKTAGTAFRCMLQAVYGDRLFLDYGDWLGYTTPEAITHRKQRREAILQQVQEIRSDYDVIHGHFQADKYLGLFEDMALVAFFRDPYQQAMSAYRYLQRHPEIDNPAVRLFHKHCMTLEDYVSHPALSNPQTQALGTVPLENFTFVGIAEEFDRSVALFNACFGANLSGSRFENVNPERIGESYPITADERRIIETHRAADLELYRQAREAFSAQLRSQPSPPH